MRFRQPAAAGSALYQKNNGEDCLLFQHASGLDVGQKLPASAPFRRLRLSACPFSTRYDHVTSSRGLGPRLRAHVGPVNTCNRHRLSHGVTSEGLPQFLVQQNLDKGGLALFHLGLDGCSQFLG